jgi:hypothetical protein
VFRRYVLLFAGLLFLRDPLRAVDPANLQIRVVEGDGQTYPLGSRATRGITIEVSDESGHPVVDAAVTFGLPESGSTGIFSNGSKTEIVTTHADGRASAWGMRWNRQAGTFDVRITATKGQARAGTVCSQTLGASAGPSLSGGGSSHKWIWIALGAAGAGAAAAVVASRGGIGSSSSGSCSSNVVLPANPCTSTPNPLGITVIGQPTINLGPK